MAIPKMIRGAAVLLTLALTAHAAEPDPNSRDGKAISEALNGWWKESMKTRDRRLQWWRDARCGCFIHWGVYSGPGGEWKGQPFRGYAEHLMRIEKIPLAEYKTEVVAKFNPTQFDAEEWVQRDPMRELA
jgi:alpha-L-fucosidase